MNRKTLISIAVFLVVVGYATYLVLDIESLTAREVEFIDRLETDIAQALGEDPAEFFPPRGRMPSKFQAGGSPPKVYKLTITTGRRGRRMTFDLSVQRNPEKAQGKFDTRWTHELRKHRLGTLAPVELKVLDVERARLAHIKSGNQSIGVFFLACRGRSLFGLTLKGITLDEFPDFEGMIAPILDILERDGPTLMLEE